MIGPNNDIIGAITIVQNITEKKLAGEVLWNSHKNLLNTIESMADAFVSLDSNWHYTYMNKNAGLIFGRDPDDIIGKHIWTEFPEGVGQPFQLAYEKAMKDQVPIELIEYYPPYKKWFENRIYPSKDGLAIFFTDITERKISEDVLRESRDRFRAIFEQAAVGIAQVQMSGRWTRVNQRFCDIVGYTHDELLELTFQDITHPDDLEADLGLVDQLVKGEIATYSLEKRYIKKDMEHVWVNLTVSLVAESIGDSKYFISVIEDITDRKKVEADLIVAKEHAEESDRLKSAFLANMSHEIRTPMNGILGFAELLKKPELTGEEQSKYIKIIEKSGARMLNIINDIVDISKIEAGLMTSNIKEININEPVKYIYTFFKPEIEAKGLQFILSKSIETLNAIVNTDREKLFAILTNLVKNAIKFTNKGSIELGCYINSKNEYTEFVFYVKDTGVGIAEDRQEAVFERFIQADNTNVNAFQGAGLGLSITKAYVEILGGKIWLESKLGVGSTFFFTLNKTSEQSNNVITNGTFENRQNKEVHNRTGLKILIAEDDETSRQLLSIMLDKYSNVILEADNGAKAVEICRNNPDIDLILMDIQMPEMNGYLATEKIRKFNKDVLIIAQTGFAQMGDREKTINAGCTDYITKPIKREKLYAIIEKYFKEIIGNRQHPFHPFG